ncbi:MAG: hypothetical protein J6B04_06515 [Clostridia bacterium]|nr:hypothetical protein [Clostridia bacterium]
MKTKLKFLLGSVISAAFVLAGVNFSIPYINASSTKGEYNGSFAAFAETQSTNEIGEVLGMYSTDGNYLLLATSLTITDYKAYTEVGYKVTKGGEAYTAEGLSTNKYYTSISVTTTNGKATYDINSVFKDSENLSAITGMIVAEITFDSSAAYTIQPYAIKDGNTVYGETQNVNQIKSFTYEVEDAMLSFSSDTRVNSPKFVTDTTVGASGDGYFKNPGYNPFVITMIIESDKDCEATMYMTAAAHKSTAMYFLMDTKEGGVIVDYTRYFSVNGEQLTQKGVTIPSNADAATSVIWTEVKCDVINLKKGRNVLVYANPGEKTMSNIDCFRFESDANLSVCTESSYTVEVEDVNITGSGYIVFDSSKTEAGQASASGGVFIGGLSGKAWTMTFNIVSDMDCEVVVYITGRVKASQQWILLDNANDATKTRVLKVNGTDIGQTGAKLPAQVDAEIWGEAQVAVISLKKGNNVVELVNGSGATCFDIDCFRFVTIGGLTIS